MAVEERGAPEEGQARLLRVLPHQRRVQPLRAVPLRGEPHLSPHQLQQVQDGGRLLGSRCIGF